MKQEKRPLIYRVRHRLASWIYGLDIDIASDLRFIVAEISGYHKAKREWLKLIDQKHEPAEGDKIHNESGNCTACELIALIKGEQK